MQRLRHACLPQVAVDCEAGPSLLEPTLPAASEDHGGAACPQIAELPHAVRATVSLSRLHLQPFPTLALDRLCVSLGLYVLPMH